MKSIAVTEAGAAATGTSALPEWFPGWARELGELYFSGTTSTFVVHGNVFDDTPLSPPTSKKRSYGTVADFLASQVFGRWDLVLHYDLARGLRCLGGQDPERQRNMVTLANRRVVDLSALKKDPTLTLAVLDRFVTKNVMAEPKDRVSCALIFDHASFLIPRGDRKDAATSRNLVTLLNWATSPYFKRINMAVVLVDSALADLSARFTKNPHVAAVQIPLPSEEDRSHYLQMLVGERPVESFSDYGLPQIAELTAGISLTDLSTLVQSSVESGRRLDGPRFQVLKKRLIERQAQSLLEFVEPTWGLDMVVGHVAAKQRLRQDAKLIAKGALETVPMGYLFCGPVGTGKSFLAQCVAGDIGIPLVKLKNFRSKYVGETEANLERVLGVLKGMGPVVVLVDEADAMLGDRDQGGDSGVGSRVFGMIAAQMGDTKYRGRIIWMLLTARPDLLPIDLKRQGRAEVHVPLFYPTSQDELRKMFVVMARKIGTTLREEDVPPLPYEGHVSGADIEGMVGRAWRLSLLSGASSITPEALQEVVAGFIPSHQSLERELQILVAILECTDKEFLVPSAMERLDALGGRGKVQERVQALKQIVDA